MLSESSITVVSAAAVTILTLFLNNFFANRKLVAQWAKEAADRKLAQDELVSQREQDRLDRITDAKIVQDNQRAIILAGERRKDEFIAKVEEVKAVAEKSAAKSEEAINIGNGHNEKIANAVNISKQVLEKLSHSPLNVSITNDAAHPVPVELEPKQ